MALLNRSFIKTNELSTKVLQFGDGNFLRAFIDWMFHELNHKTNFNAGIKIIKVRPGKGKIDTLNNQNGLYTLLLNGIKNGKKIKEHHIIDCIQKGINPYENFEEYFNEASNPDLEFLVSNTTEAGIVFNSNDKLTDKPQSSFPGKVTAFLYKRFKFFKGNPNKGLIFFPCELIDNNGTQLKEIIIKHATNWKIEAEFIEWVKKHNIFCNTLVDRIVSGHPKEHISEIQKELQYEDPLLVVGEQYHLFVIEAPKIVQEKFPTDKIGLNVIFTKNLNKYKTLKVRILNGAHTTLVPVSYLYGIDKVRESAENKVVNQYLQKVIKEDVFPTLDFPHKELQKYAEDVIDRFKNPYLEHELMSISLNSISKYRTRVLPSVLEHIKHKQSLPKGLLFSLAALIAFYKGDRNGKRIALKDNQPVLDFFATQWSTGNPTTIVNATLSNMDFWGMDLTKINGLEQEVLLHLNSILNYGMKSALENFVAYDN